jgi:hypothetical protein
MSERRETEGRAKARRARPRAIEHARQRGVPIEHDAAEAVA